MSKRKQAAARAASPPSDPAPPPDDPLTSWTEAAIEWISKAMVETQRMRISPLVEAHHLDAHAETLRQILAEVEQLDEELRRVKWDT